MGWSQTNEDGVAVLRPAGDFGARACETAANLLRTLLADGAGGGLVLNLSGVRGLDPSGVGFLARLAAALRRSGRRLALCGASEAHRELLAMAALRDHLEWYDFEGEAVEALNPSAARFAPRIPAAPGASAVHTFCEGGHHAGT